MSALHDDEDDLLRSVAIQNAQSILAARQHAERELVAAYVAGTGYDLDDLRSRDDDEARGILTQASLYASTRLSEVEARLHYLRAIRGEV